MGYGVDTDIWGFGDSNFKIQSAPKSIGNNEAQCPDSFGTVSASTVYDTVTEVSATYKMAKDVSLTFYDTTTAIDFRLGKVIGGFVLTGIDASTSNTDYTEITLSGRSCTSADSEVAKFVPTAGLITLARKGQAIGVIPDTTSASKVTGSSYSASVSVTTCADSTGDYVALDVYAGREEATTSLVGCTGDPSAVADTGWTISSGPNESKENTSYATGDVTVFKNLPKA